MVFLNVSLKIKKIKEIPFEKMELAPARLKRNAHLPVSLRANDVCSMWEKE